MIRFKNRGFVKCVIAIIESRFCVWNLDYAKRIRDFRIAIVVSLFCNVKSWLSSYFVVWNRDFYIKTILSYRVFVKFLDCRIAILGKGNRDRCFLILKSRDFALSDGDYRIAIFKSKIAIFVQRFSYCGFIKWSHDLFTIKQVGIVLWRFC